MKRSIYIFIIFILSACSSLQATEETDCCLPVNFTAPAPTETQTPVATFTETPRPTLSPEEQAEIYAFETKMAEYPSICNIGYPYHFSPNGLWREEFCYSESDKSLVLTVSNKNTKVFWKMLYKDYIPKGDFVSDGGMSISHWSNDERYAYFNAHMSGSGGGCFLAYNSDHGWGVFRLDLQTGNVEEILPVFDNRIVFYDFSFSPTDRRLVYRRSQEDIVILDMKTGSTLRVNHYKDFEDEGGFLWSEDGLKFIYSTGTFTSNSEIYSLRLVDVSTGDETMLLESESTTLVPGNCYVAKEWKDSNTILIEQNQYTNQDIIETTLEYDLITNTFQVIP
ncbi:MAG: hypothetical protein JNJ43_03345 [Anaerolineales bacterium]|nr:hypothetical protein [Anaerolineales bacterium]